MQAWTVTLTMMPVTMKTMLCKMAFCSCEPIRYSLTVIHRLKAQRKADQLSRLESRQEAMKRRQAEREEQENKRMKLHHIQREEQRAQKVRNEARKKLEEEERLMHRKEEQVERDMRKYSVNRIKPLGRDKFYNRYYYMDDIGGTLLHGSGKLYVQSPSDTDLMVLQERDVVESIDANTTLPCGRGGGVKFVSQLMKEQGLVAEAEFFENRVEKLKQNTANLLDEWWQTYDDPEDVRIQCTVCVASTNSLGCRYKN